MRKFGREDLHNPLEVKVESKERHTDGLLQIWGQGWGTRFGRSKGRNEDVPVTLPASLARVA